MRALQRAVALAEMDDAAPAIAENLDLDVPGPLEVAFEIDLAAAEKRRRLVLRDRQQAGEVDGVPGHFHAAPAAAGAGLDQHRVADRADRRLGCREVAHRTRRARNRRDTELTGRLLG